ncbi:variable large family protein [Borreliella burgdorferi]|uniref:variable large family protein n=1 Tax=Borreliella burgdorferi TaxID=139 RepID=UPI003AA99C4E
MAKGGKFSLAAQDNADHKAGVKSAAQSGTAKTVNALTSIIQKAAEEGLKKVADAVKGIAASGKLFAGAADGAENIGDVGSANNKGAGGDPGSVNGIADGMKAIVEAAGGAEKVLKGVGAAGGGADNNNDAGKLFAGSGAGANGAADAADVGKAVAAVNAVSGEQILKAIVDAAGGDAKVGAAANAANNPIAAAIGTNNGAAFANGMQNKNDKIAAAIVLRGMAKGGKFSLAAQGNADHKAGVKSAAQSGTAKTVNALTSIIQKAAEEGLKKVADAVKGIAASGKKLFAGAAGGAEKIGDVGGANHQGAEG